MSTRRERGGPQRASRRSFLRHSAAAAGASALGWGRDRSKAVAGGGAAALRVLVWCEGTAPRAVYPKDVDGAIAGHLGRQAMSVRKGRLGDPDAGLGDEALDAADVLIWWSRLHHDDVPDQRAEAVAARVRAGKLGLVALYASAASKPFRALMRTACEPGGWRDDGRPEHVKVAAPGHPIARGVGAFTLPRSDMFTEPFRVPEPETVVLVSTWDHGETVRSGLTWTVEKGRVVYLRTGPDASPVLNHPSVRRLVANAAHWAGGRA